MHQGLRPLQGRAENTNNSEEEVRIMPLGEAIAHFPAYDDYLDSQICEEDMYFLEDHRMIQQIIERGSHKSQGKFSRKDFETAKLTSAAKENREKEEQYTKTADTLALKQGDVFLEQLDRRKEAVLEGRLATIIFLRTRSAKGHEISAYMDYAHRLATDGNWSDVFAGHKNLTARPSDLSYFNWNNLQSSINDTSNFSTVIGDDLKVHFRCKRDFRIIQVGPQNEPTADVSRTAIRSKKYMQVVLYDHWKRFWCPEDVPPFTTLQMSVNGKIAASDLTLPALVDVAIFEEDLIDIARNALGTSQKPNDVRCTAREGTDTTTQLKRFQDNLVATMKVLYDIESNDARNQTLGTFAHQQMIEECKRLLPEDITQHERYTKETRLEDAKNSTSKKDVSNAPSEDAERRLRRPVPLKQLMAHRFPR